jgi:hypothetical protein
MKSRITTFLVLSLLFSFTAMKAVTQNTSQQTVAIAQLNTVLDSYFLLKDALVKSDGKEAAATARELLKAVEGVKNADLNKKEQDVWLKVNDKIKEDAQKIAATQDVKAQRALFVNLSKNMHALAKVSNYSQPVYAQFCPMANKGKGASWLSKENAVKNPYYGSQMLSCGRITETIK